MSEFYNPVTGELAMALIILVIGAFYGQVCSKMVYRLGAANLGANSVFRPSFCPKCGKPIALVDKIPVYSYLRLKGKCARCGEPIAGRYLFFELTGMILPFLLLWYENFSVIALLDYVFIMAFLTGGLVCKDTGRAPYQVSLFLVLPQSLKWWLSSYEPQPVTEWIKSFTAEPPIVGMVTGLVLSFLITFIPHAGFRRSFSYALFGVCLGLCFGLAKTALLYALSLLLCLIGKAYFALERKKAPNAGIWIYAAGVLTLLFGDQILSALGRFMEFALR